jgi:16S rRNA processing protein RimM
MFIVGKVLKPQGVKGEVKVEIITSFPERFTTLNEVFLKNKDQWNACRIENVRISGNFAYIKFADINSRDLAEKLRNEYLHIPDDDLKELGEDEYYIHDLIDLDVFDEDGDCLGTITDVENYKSNDIYVVQSPNGEQHMIPAIKDFIKEIDLSANKMIIRRIEGLIE